MNNGIPKPIAKFGHINPEYEETYNKVDKTDFPLFFDVDGTLLGWGDEINWKLVNEARRAKQAGYKLVLWSYGGASWARRFATLSQTEDLWDYIMGKPGVVIDDHHKKGILDLGEHLYPDVAADHLVQCLEDGGY